MQSSSTLDRRTALSAFGTLALGPAILAGPGEVSSTPIAERGVIGEFHLSKEKSSRTAVIMLSGSDGGIPSPAFARDLAASGIPTLALAYLQDASGRPEGVPAAAPVPLETVFRALDWMRRRVDAAPDRLILMGLSRGAELALLVASLRPDVGGVVAFSPGSHVWGGVSSSRGYVFDTAMWTLGGRAMSYQVHLPKLGRPVREWFSAAPDVEAARIRVEAIGGPILLVSSTADAIWPAAEYADFIEGRLRQATFPHLVCNLKFSDASHLLMGSGPAPTEIVLPGTNGYVMRFGGSAVGTFNARNLAWSATKQFLHEIGA